MIKTTHDGSLPRTQNVVDFIFDRENGKDFDRTAFGTAMTEGRAETMRRQTEAGIDTVPYGETSKINCATYVKDRYTGFDGDSLLNSPVDLKLFRRFLACLADDGGTPTCVGELLNERFSGFVGADCVVAAYAKLGVLSDGARLASERL
jgi:5-methyltetrahydropteroyltriglutamate--homocysteine methyltransferase